MADKKPRKIAVEQQTDNKKSGFRGRFKKD